MASVNQDHSVTTSFSPYPVATPSKLLSNRSGQQPNDPASGLTDGETATVDSVERDGVRLRLESGSVTKLGKRDPRLRHVDRAFAATVHAFQGRTVDRIVAALPAGTRRLTDQRAFHVAIGRARMRAELVTDDALAFPPCSAYGTRKWDRRRSAAVRLVHAGMLGVPGLGGDV